MELHEVLKKELSRHCHNPHMRTLRQTKLNMESCAKFLELIKGDKKEITKLRKGIEALDNIIMVHELG